MPLPKHLAPGGGAEGASLLARKAQLPAAFDEVVARVRDLFAPSIDPGAGVAQMTFALGFLEAPASPEVSLLARLAARALLDVESPTHAPDNLPARLAEFTGDAALRTDVRRLGVGDRTGRIPVADTRTGELVRMLSV